MAICIKTNAQDYKGSIGVVAGYYDGFNYKGLFGKNFALDLTLAYATWEQGVVINPVALYQARIMTTKELSWFCGGGAFVGFSPFGAFWFSGINTMGGIEYKFSIPLALSFDFRPGLGFMTGFQGSEAYFSWPINITAKYTF